jgi:hypothetical protein
MGKTANPVLYSDMAPLLNDYFEEGHNEVGSSDPLAFTRNQKKAKLEAYPFQLRHPISGHKSLWAVQRAKALFTPRPIS